MHVFADRVQSGEWRSFLGRETALGHSVLKFDCSVAPLREIVDCIGIVVSPIEEGLHIINVIADSRLHAFSGE